MSGCAEPGGAACSPACLCVLCGLPGAGKSSLARDLPAVLGRRGWGCLVLGYDDLIPEEAFERRGEDAGVPADTQSSWRSYRQGVLRCLDRFLQSPSCAAAECGAPGGPETWDRFVRCLRESPGAPLIIILDDNFYYPSMRYEVYQLARKYSLGFCVLYLQCAMSTCLSRNRRRSRPLPDRVIEDMALRIEPPDPRKNPWEQSSLALCSTDGLSQQDGQKVMELIAAALDKPLSPVQDLSEEKDTARRICASSVLHQVDQACRRLVSQAMQDARDRDASPSGMRALAAELGQLKGRLLEDLRRRALQDGPAGLGDGVEAAVSRAVALFDRDKTDLMRRFCTVTPP
ncbi:L-seryl-tRNA(Sec) kinase isoform X1 [Amia ocellicauda]|uniref:L-seryl-tRNA(Sec) kinase isoform X1 n=1 Tax=Amia ocellicauda TaxID=2972642 RepID=UPI003463D287